MILWCTLHVFLVCGTGDTVCSVETAVKGKVVDESVMFKYKIDFSEYAKKQKYIGNYSEVTVDRDNCIKDKK